MACWCRVDAGASPLFSPAHQDLEVAAGDLQEVVHHHPQLHGLSRSRWRLTDLRQVIPWMAKLSLPGICRLLKRLEVSYKRGRAHVHSPDLQYPAKLASIARARELAQQAPAEVVFLYEDEFTFYSRPPVGRTYAPRGHTASKASGAALETRRIAACVDVASGAVIARQRDHFNVKEMARFFWYVERQYPDAAVIYLALDNWPVHFHAFVQDYLAQHHSRIRFLPLPTYAPWTNPVEKLWLLFHEDFLDQHPFGQCWEALKQAITDWFAGRREGSAELLHTIGLLPD